MPSWARSRRAGARDGWSPRTAGFRASPPFWSSATAWSRATAAPPPPRRASSGEATSSGRSTGSRAIFSCAPSALCYFVAFVSLWVQVAGLIGSRGILPVGEFLDAVRAQTGGARFDLLPTLCWLDASDAFLNVLCGAGAAAALLAVAGRVPAWSLLFCWVSYLSLCVAGQVFFEFQWDSLLLEAGLLAVLLAPRGFRLSRAKAPPSRRRPAPPALAPLAPHVRLGLREARQRRSQLARPLGSAAITTRRSPCRPGPRGSRTSFPRGSRRSPAR